MTPQVFIDGEYIDIEFRLADDSVFSVTLDKVEAMHLANKLLDGVAMMGFVNVRTEIK
jgi:hypothetical protein